MILLTIKVGRNIFENMRKFTQYQLTVALNLMIYIFMGQLLFTSMPIPPFLILLMNTSMDTFALNILAIEHPQEGYDIFKTLPKKRKATIKQGGENEVRDIDFDPRNPACEDFEVIKWHEHKEPIMNWNMYLNMILSTVYIQSVLFLVFYNGRLLFDSEDPSYNFFEH